MFFIGENQKKILLLFINENFTKIQILHVEKKMCPCDTDLVAHPVPVQRYKATVIVIQFPQTQDPGTHQKG